MASNNSYSYSSSSLGDWKSNISVLLHQTERNLERRKTVIPAPPPSSLLQSPISNSSRRRVADYSFKIPSHLSVVNNYTSTSNNNNLNSNVAASASNELPEL